MTTRRMIVAGSKMLIGTAMLLGFGLTTLGTTGCAESDCKSTTCEKQACPKAKEGCSEKKSCCPKEGKKCNKGKDKKSCHKAEETK